MNPTTITKKQYAKNLFGVASIGLGAFLIIEHIWSWGEFSFYDVLGHEWLGVILIICGILMNINFKTPLSVEILKPSRIKEWFK